MSRKIRTEEDYNEGQQEVAKVRDAFIEEGLDKTTAARYALAAVVNPAKAFVEHLSDGGLTIEDKKVKIVPVEESTEESAEESAEEPVTS